jgi:hypothetical protein
MKEENGTQLQFINFSAEFEKKSSWIFQDRLLQLPEFFSPFNRNDTHKPQAPNKT